MRIELTGLGPRVHRFEVFRFDGSRDRVELETRSYLVHDLTHFAVEHTLGLTEGFYGLLASGHRLATLNDRTRPWPEGTQLALAESIVGPMQSYLTGKHQRPLAWSFVDDVAGLYRQLWGRWRGTPFGQSCVLQWGCTSQCSATRGRGSQLG